MKNLMLVGMVEKWDPALGPRNPQDLREPRDPNGSWDPQDPCNPWHLRVSGHLEIPSTVWTSEFKHPETLKLKHKQKTSLNYIIEQSRTKAENCMYLSEVFLFIEWLIMIIRGKSPSLLPSSYATVINRSNQRHLIGYTWIEKDSQFSDVTVYKIII